MASDMLLVRNGPYLKRAKHWWASVITKRLVGQVEGMVEKLPSTLHGKNGL